jgi:hypothetical protein
LYISLRDIEKKIISDLDLGKAFEHLQYLVNEIGERIAGTPAMIKAAYYIENKLREFGIDEVYTERFKIYHSFPVSAEIRVLYPEQRIIDAKPLCHIMSTGPDGITGEVVYVGSGGYEDYNNKDVRGKIVLADMTWDPARPEKARIAAERGAKAIIIMNWGPDEGTHIQMGAIKGVWGNPTPDNFVKIPQIVGVSISRSSGLYLKKLLEKHNKVILRIRAEATREWVDAHQPIGRIRVGRSKYFILIGGHLEAWGKTAICNSSGNALMLELARVLNKHKDKFRRDIIFAFWDGHEIAEAAGSTYFVDTHFNELQLYGIVYLNIDNVGIRGTSIPYLWISDPSLLDFIKPIAEEIFETNKIKVLYMYKGGDASFFGVGIPYIFVYTGYTEEDLKKLNYASLSPWIHSEEDTLDKIDKDLFEKHLKFYAILTTRLATIEILPYNVIQVVDKLIEDLRNLDKICSEIRVDDIIELAEKLKMLIIELDNYKEKVQNKLEKNSSAISNYKGVIELINKGLIKIVRNTLHILKTVAGRYEQDPYDYTFVKKPIPRLYIPITELCKSKKDSHEYMLWYTKLLREKNSIIDSIQNIFDYLEIMLPLLREKL